MFKKNDIVYCCPTCDDSVVNYARGVFCKIINVNTHSYEVKPIDPADTVNLNKFTSILKSNDIYIVPFHINCLKTQEYILSMIEKEIQQEKTFYESEMKFFLATKVKISKLY